MNKHPENEALSHIDWNLTPPKPNVALPEQVLYDERQASAMLGVCPRTVRNLADRGLIPRVRMLSAVRYDVADLRAFIERAKQSSKTSTGDVEALQGTFVVREGGA